MIVSPSILAADFSKLGEEIRRVKAAQWLHIDVMDGVFVPNISLGVPIIKAIRRESGQIFDVHLMVERPLRHIKAFAGAGADIISVHAECADDMRMLINEIKACGKKAGIVVKPKTKISEIEKYLDDVYMVMVMTVEPGFGGQEMLTDELYKVRELKNLRRDLIVEVDGGVNESTALLCKETGTDVIVAGTAVFKAENAEEKIKFLEAL